MYTISLTAGRLVGKSTASHSGNLSSYPGGGLDYTNAWMKGEEIISHKSDITPVRLNGWCIIIVYNTKRHILRQLHCHLFLPIYIY